MSNKFRSEDDAPIVENPIVADNNEGEVIAATATTEPDMPPTTPIEPIADVESTREPEADPTVPEQRFRFRQEDPVEPAPVEEAPAAPAEAPTAPVDAPVEAPAADALPADAPAPEALPGAAPAEGAPVEAPIADVPAAAPMVAPQPEADVAPMAPAADGAVAPAAPVAPEVAAPTEAPAEPVDDAPVQCGGSNGGKGRSWKNEDGEEMSVVTTPEPELPTDTEATECPVSGEPCVDKDIKEPINPVIAPNQIDENLDGDEDGADDGTEPVEDSKTDDITILEPEAAEKADEADLGDIEQCMRMGDDEGAGEGESGDQNVEVKVAVEGPDTQSHEGEDAAPQIAEAPEQYFRQDGEVVETVADVQKVDAGETPAEAEVNAAVPDPVDPNAGDPNPDPEQCFNQFFQDGGNWL